MESPKLRDDGTAGSLNLLRCLHVEGQPLARTYEQGRRQLDVLALESRGEVGLDHP